MALPVLEAEPTQTSAVRCVSIRGFMECSAVQTPHNSYSEKVLQWLIASVWPLTPTQALYGTECFSSDKARHEKANTCWPSTFRAEPNTYEWRSSMRVNAVSNTSGSKPSSICWSTSGYIRYLWSLAAPLMSLSLITSFTMKSKWILTSWMARTNDSLLTNDSATTNRGSPSPQNTLEPLVGHQSTHTRDRVPSIPELQEIVTYGGSVRLRTVSLENLQQMQSQQLASVGPNARAVENTYHFVWRKLLSQWKQI